MTTAVDFDAPDLGARIEQLSRSDIDRLPFGVIHIDREGTVLFYSETEARASGYETPPLGRNFFEISHRMTSEDFRGLVMRADEAGPVDLEFGWPGDFGDPTCDLRVRVQSARAGGFWICIERDCGRDGRAR